MSPTCRPHQQPALGTCRPLLPWPPPRAPPHLLPREPRSPVHSHFASDTPLPGTLQAAFRVAILCDSRMAHSSAGLPSHLPPPPHSSPQGESASTGHPHSASLSLCPLPGAPSCTSRLLPSPLPAPTALFPDGRLRALPAGSSGSSALRTVSQWPPMHLRPTASDPERCLTWADHSRPSRTQASTGSCPGAAGGLLGWRHLWGRSICHSC